MKQLIGFRFFLSLQILLLHSFPFKIWDNFAFLINSAYISTSFFIIISGFTLSYVYSNKEISSTLRFAAQRISKLLPLAVLTSLFCFVLSSYAYLRNEFPLFINPNDNNLIKVEISYFQFLLHFVEQFLCLDGWNVFYLSLNIPSWTLSVFFLGYLLFPKLLKAFKNMSIRKIIIVTFFVWFFMLIIPTYYSLRYNGMDGQNLNLFGIQNILLGIMHRFPLLRILEFIIGMSLYFIYKRYEHIKIESLLVIPFFTITIFIFTKYIPRPLLHNGLYIPFQLLLLWSLLKENIVYRLLSSKIFQILGGASFSLYLIHIPLLSVNYSIAKRILILLKLNYSNNSINEFIKSNALYYVLYLAFIVFMSVIVQKYFVDKIYMFIKRKYFI
jgi:peptidoglycan/LPS O-acetylase OafA/YrhL